MDKSLILKNIKEHFFFKKDVDFAKFLGISSQTLSNWYSRNTFDAQLIYTKCENINSEWLLTGKGEMLKKDSTNKQEDASYNVSNDIKNDTLNESAQIYNTAQNLSSIIDDKNKIIAGYEFRFASLEKDLENCINEKKILQNNRTSVL